MKNDSVESAKLNKANVKETKRLSLNLQNNSAKEDPLLKFSKPKEAQNKQVSDSLSYLKQFSGNVAFIKQKSDNSTLSSRQEISQKYLASIGVSKQVPEEKLQSFEKGKASQTDFKIAEIPPFNKQKSKEDISKGLQLISWAPEKNNEQKEEVKRQVQTSPKPQKLKYGENRSKYKCLFLIKRLRY